MTLADFRAQYPAYDDMSDTDLANALYNKHYSDMDRADFYARLGIEDEEESGLLDSVGEFASSVFSPFGRGLDEEQVQDVKDTTRGIAGGITSASAGAVAGVTDMAATAADRMWEGLGYAIDEDVLGYVGSAREAVKPFVEEMRDVQGLERDISQELAPESGVGKVAYDSTIAMGQMAPMIAAFMITKNPNVALSTMGTQVGGQTWSDAKAKGWTDTQAALETAKQVAYEIGPERIFGVFQKMGGMNALRDFAELAVAESGSEATTELLNIMEESINKGDSFGEFWENMTSKESADRVNYAALLGGILGLGMGGPGAVSTYTSKQRAMDLEEDMNVGDYVRANQARRSAETIDLGALRQRSDAEHQQRLAEAQANLARMLGGEQDRTDFLYEGELGQQRLDDIPEVRLQDDFGRPMDNVTLDGFENIDSLPTLPEATEEVDPNAPTQAEIELLGRQRDPRELRDPQNVPPVGQAMVDEVFNLDQYTPEDLANYAREHINSREREQVPGLRQRSLEEIDQLERDATQGSGMWKSNAIKDLQTIVRAQLDSRDLQGRVAERLRVMPAEDVVEVSQESGTQVVEEAPGEAPQITESGRKIAKRFQVVKDGDRGYFEVVSFEPQDTKVHIRYNTIPAKRHQGELDAGQEMAYTDAWIDINEPNVVHIVGSVGTRKKVFPKKWRAEVTQKARELRTGFDVKEGQRMRGRVTAKVPFVGAPTLAMHTAQLEGQYLADARASKQSPTLTKEEELRAREAARKDAKETQQRALQALLDSQADVEGGLVKMPSLPAHELDRGINIETRISKGALARINNGTATHERVFQVLPDGRMRTLEVVPQGKGKRYAVYALAEGGNKFVSPATTSGRSLVSEGVKIAEVGPVVKDATLEKIKQQGERKTLSDGLRIIRQRKRTAGDAEAQALSQKDALEEGRQAAESVDYQRILNKEAAQRKARRERQAQEKAAAEAEGIPYIPEQAGSAEGRGAEPILEEERPDIDIMDTETVSLEDVVEEEGAALAPDEVEFEASQQLAAPEQVEELTEEEMEELAGYSRGAADAPKRLARLLERTTNILGNNAKVRARVIQAYDLNRAKVERAVADLESWAEVDPVLAERAAKKGSGRSAAGEFDLRVYVDSGGQLTLRGTRQLSQVRAAINAIMAESPNLGSKTFPQLIEEAKVYLATRPELPLNQQENLNGMDLSELFLVAASAQNIRTPRSKKGWTEAEVTDIAEVAELLVKEFGVSPVEAATRAQEILYGKNIGTDEFGHKRTEGYPDLHNRTAQVVKAMNDRRSEAQVGGTITAEEAAAKRDLEVRDNLIRQVRDQLIVARARDERQASFEAVLDDALRRAGFGQQAQQVLDAVASQKAATGVAIGSLQDKIARLEAALKEKDTLRTNYNAPKPPPAPTPVSRSWSEQLKQEYEAKYPKPPITPQMELDISTLMKMKGPKVDKTKGKVEESTLIEDDVPVAERELKAAEARKKKEAAARKKKGLKFKGKSVDEAVSLADQIGPGYGIEMDVLNSAKLRWKAGPVKLDENVQPETAEEVEAVQRTTPLDEAAGLDAAAAFDASMAVSYAASVAPIRNAQEGLGDRSAWRILKRYFSKEHGSVKGTLAAYNEAEGFIQLWHERAMGHWSLALGPMKEGGWSRAKDDAVTHYLQGMSRASVAAKTEYTIPSESIRALDALKADIDQLSTLGVESGAFTKTNVVAAILGGRAYLTHKLGQTTETTKQVHAMMPELARLFEEAYPSLTEAEIDRASANKLFNTIEHRLPNLQENLSTATYDGKEIGKKEGQKYLVRQLSVEGLAAPVPLAVVSESGTMLEVIAQKERLQDIVRENITEGVTPEQEVQRMVDSMLTDETRTGVVRGRGANYGIQQARRVLRSDSELIRDAAVRLLRKGSSREMKSWVSANVAASRSGTIDEFLTKVEEQFPDQRPVVDQLRAENELNKKLREALNEITDPATLISKTVDSIAETIAMARFGSDMYRLLRSQNLASVGQAPGGAVNWKPLMPKGSALGDGNFVAIDAKNPQAEGPGVRKIHEMYVPREVADAIHDITGYGRQLESGATGATWRSFRWVSKWTKYGKVIANPLAHPRNLISTALIHASRAGVGHNLVYANAIMAELGLDQAKLSLGDRGRTAKTKGQSARSVRLEELMLENGLFFDGGKVGAIYDLTKKTLGYRNEGTGKKHKWRRRLEKTKNFAENAFRLEDEAVKAAGLITFASDYIQLTGGNPDIVKKYLETGNLTEAEQAVFNKAIKVAAEQVKNNYPTFSRTPEAIKILSRSPILGAFPSFSSEMIRTTGHLMYNSVRLMEGTLPDGTKVAQGQRTRAFVLGASRLSATTALFSSAAVVTQLILEKAFGDDDDESMAWYQYLTAYGTDSQRKVRGLLPFWQRDSLTGIKDIDPEAGTFQTVAVSYISPYGAINDVINSMVHSYKDAAEAGVGSPEWEAFKAMLEGSIGIFGNTEPLAGNLYKRWTRAVSKRESANDAKNWANAVDKAIGEYFEGEAGNVIGGLVGGTIESLTFEIVPQAIAGAKLLAGQIAASAPNDNALAQDAAFEAANRFNGIADMLSHVAGLKSRPQSFTEDVIPGLAMDKLIYQRTNTKFKNTMAAAYDQEDYYSLLKEEAAKRRLGWMTIRDRFKATEDFLDKDWTDIVAATEELGQRFRSAGDNSLADFVMDEYSIPSPEEFWDFMKSSRTLTLTDEQKMDAYDKYSDAYLRYWEEEQPR